nr:hypothetical protein [Flavobacterium sp.]
MVVVVSKYLIPKGFDGLAIYPFILVSQNHLKQNLVIINHEKIHIRQQLELLILLFFIWYSLEFLFRWIQYKDRRKAYLNISFEREAYKNEKDLNYLNQRSFWTSLNYL